MTTQDLWNRVRADLIGGDADIETPFGSRRLTYADHTASGRAVAGIEAYLGRVLELYGNTHTEDDATGMVTSERLRQAESTIKRLVNAGPDHRIIAVGAGTTGAVHRLQQILGVYLPPAGKDQFQRLLTERLGEAGCRELSAWLRSRRPVVFVGPYEHHSNEVSWRECFAEVVEIDLDGHGRLDLEDLRRTLGRDEYRGRRLIGAFSAASNVSGVRTPVHEVARILHEHGAVALFDYAAAAPYERLDMSRDPASTLDAVYFSPHKFVGGPGSCGILVIHKRLYREDLPPTVGAGGTVDFVDFDGQTYASDIEVREKAGTPPILQTLRASLAMELAEALGYDRIASTEASHVRLAHQLLGSHPAIELMGDVGLADRLPIFSFNIRVGDSWLHPRYVTLLLNDLFGIQSRAGCSCAAPYGHRLLHIDSQKSQEIRRTILRGNVGLKPGWARVSFHFLATEAEVRFICRAIRFVADQGSRFLARYRFDVRTGRWRHRDARQPETSFGLAEALGGGEVRRGGGRLRDDRELDALFESYLTEAERLAAALGAADLRHTEERLIPFVYSQEEGAG
ncbi:MAG TPA: aminotransferase class V-fold PLP-dependent enzyme [Spirochaetia bacterium]|nr:aminotransferase class V-fold PLP-dependent enzyme [Spirochaetia bacterium]